MYLTLLPTAMGSKQAVALPISDILQCHYLLEIFMKYAPL